MAHRAAAPQSGSSSIRSSRRNSTEPLLAHLRAFCFPGGEDASRQIRGVKISEKGEMQSSPQAQWIPFTAELTIDTKQSSFCGTARPAVAKILPVTVTDAYEQHHGKLIAKVGPLTTQKVEGRMPTKANFSAT
jgi:hypothetical protein